MRAFCHLSTTQVALRLQHSTLHRILKGIERDALKRWYTWTCSPQMAQPDDHPSAGGLLHHLLTLTLLYINSMAVVFFYRHLPSPTASIFGSGVPYAARTFLSCAYAQQRQNRDTVSNGMQRYCKFLSNGNDWDIFIAFRSDWNKSKNRGIVF